MEEEKSRKLQTFFFINFKNKLLKLVLQKNKNNIQYVMLIFIFFYTPVALGISGDLKYNKT